MSTNTANVASHEVNAAELEQRVKAMYQAVAEKPEDDFHFEMGRGMAERLGYPAVVLEQTPAAAIDSFAGVGYYFHLSPPIKHWDYRDPW